MAIAAAPPFVSYVRVDGGAVPQVMWEGQWREVGGPHVDGAVATVICRQLGYRKGTVTSKSCCVDGRDYICSGTEPGLTSCTFVDVTWAERGYMACSDPVGEPPGLPAALSNTQAACIKACPVGIAACLPAPPTRGGYAPF